MIDDSNLITPRDWVIIVIFFVLRERTRERVFDIHSELPVGFFDGTTLTILCSSARTLIRMMIAHLIVTQRLASVILTRYLTVDPGWLLFRESTRRGRELKKCVRVSQKRKRSDNKHAVSRAQISALHNNNNNNRTTTKSHPLYPSSFSPATAFTLYFTAAEASSVSIPAAVGSPYDVATVPS